jgi:putative ABC transport system ATP-binding protein
MGAPLRVANLDDATDATGARSAEAVFRARGLTKTYLMGEVRVPALQGVDLDLFKGEFVVILGPSGSGKSTLLNILGGLDAPTGGLVRFHDHDLVGAGDRALTTYRREHVGFVFQFYNLIPSLTARENVALVTELAANPMTPEEALGLVGLGDRLDHFPAQLSGGEQQRVAIARAIVSDPRLLLCDEPTGDLDRTTADEILATLQILNRDLGKTIVLVTHDPAAARYARRTLHLDKGRFIEKDLAA